jgi:hypothetical protein
MSEHSGGADTVRDVKTTTVRLPDDLAAALEAEAEQQGVSSSSLVREGILLRLAVAAAVRAGRTDVLADLVRQLERLR